MRDEDVEPTGEPTSILSEEQRVPRGTSMVTWLLLGLTLLFGAVAGISLFVLSKERVEAQKAREDLNLISLKSQQLQASLEEEKTRGLRDAEAVRTMEADKLRLAARVAELEAKAKTAPTPPPPPPPQKKVTKPTPASALKKKPKTPLKRTR